MKVAQDGQQSMKKLLFKEKTENHFLTFNLIEYHQEFSISPTPTYQYPLVSFQSSCYLQLILFLSPIPQIFTSPLPIQTIKPAASRSMSSDSASASEPSAPPIPHNPPCMFTVEQFQQPPESQNSNSEPLNVYVVRPNAIWEILERFKRLVGTSFTTTPYSTLSLS